MNNNDKNYVIWGLCGGVVLGIIFDNLAVYMGCGFIIGIALNSRKK